MAERTRCEICDRTFKNEEGLAMHNQAKHANAKSERSKKVVKKTKNWMIFIIITGLIIFGLYWTISNITSAQALPPTSMEGHTEQLPSSHVMREPMGIAIQKHMLEHVDGQEGVRGGVIINYNCDDFECESGLIENLETFATKYDYVYVAPFKNMPSKIALTQLRRIEVLEEYDENKIEAFITGIVPQGNDNVKEFDMIARQWEFSPDSITVKEGDSVRLKIKSIDVAHGIAINTFGVNQRLNPGQETVVEFVADKKGTFTFACSVSCGVGHRTMVGKIIVK